MTIDQISVFVENKPAQLAAITKVLGDAGIDLRAMSIADTSDFGILRIIVNDSARAQEALKAADCVVSVTEVLAVEIADQPGSLAAVLSVLAEAGISVEYLYAFITRKRDEAYVVLRVENPQKAAEILAGRDIRIASAQELYDI
jgi:hypothetical protein